MTRKLDKALDKISEFIDQNASYYYKKQFEKIHEMPGGDKIFRRISFSTNKHELEDYLAEIQYVLIFAGLGFNVEIEPMGSKGPDLKIYRNTHQAIVEIMRLRQVYPGPPELTLSNVTSILPEYGNPERDIRKATEKIIAKFPQISLANEKAIIAIWNNEGDLDDLEVREAVNLLNTGMIPLPLNLSFVLYGSKWLGRQQFYCYQLGQQEEYLIEWQKELNRSTVNMLIQQALEQ